MAASETPTPRMGVESLGRERWPGRFSFVMAAIGSAIGLGNVWRFPAVAYANGGGAFFIPYFVALLTAGIPLLILEFAVGQMMQKSAPGSLKNLNKHFEWVGWFALLVGTVIAIYYAVIMAYSWNYLAFSFSMDMPWSAGGAGTEGEFFENTFLKVSTKPGEMWGIQWWIVAGLAATWAAVFFIIYKGVRRVGKIVMITVPLPWIILLILAIRGLTLEGASAGIEYYLRPDFEALKKPATWLAAYGQVFFSLTLGFGVMIAYASYRPKNADVTNNAFIMSFANCATSFLAGFAVFSVLGFLAFKNGVPVESVVKGGPGLAFATYPAAITRMGDLGWIWPPLIGVLFFVALLTLGIDSLFSLIEAIQAGFHDRYPNVKRVHIAALLCGGCFLVGVLICTRAGFVWLDLLDHWATNYGLVIVGLLQCLLVGYFLHSHSVRDFANEVSEIKLGGWWELCIKTITPIVLVYLIAQKLITEFAEPYGAGEPGLLVWGTRAAFIALFLIAFAITRRWSYLALGGVAVIVGVLTFAVVRPASLAPEAKVEAAETADGDPKKVSFETNAAGMREPVIARWDFGDGKASDELDPTHSYAEPGTYEVTLSAHGKGGRGRAAKAGLTVHARPLEIVEARLFRRKGTQDVANPLAYGFAAKVDYGKPPYQCEWAFGDGEVVTGVKGEHDYKEPGTYDATLTVTDATGRSATKAFAVDVLPFAVELRADPQGGETPAVVGFKARVYDLGGDELDEAELNQFDFSWDFGDGDLKEALGGDQERPDPRGISHRYDYPAPAAAERAGQEGENEGEKEGAVRKLTASLTVRDNEGRQATESVAINLRPPEEHAPGRAALLSAVAAMLLLGGLGLCLRIAWKSGKGGTAALKGEANA